MWRWILGCVAAFLLIVVVIGTFLGPNDLRMCGSSPSAQSSCEQADAIVAISGGDTRARTAEAITLYQNGWSKRMIFSGAADDPNSPSNARIMEQQALQAGVPASAVLLDSTSRSTQENASNSSNIFVKNNIHSVILVTSAYHQRRAYLEFRKYSPDVTIRNHPVAGDDQWSNLWWLTPQGWWLATSEIAKIIGFYIGARQ